MLVVLGRILVKQLLAVVVIFLVRLKINAAGRKSSQALLIDICSVSHNERLSDYKIVLLAP